MQQGATVTRLQGEHPFGFFSRGQAQHHAEEVAKRAAGIGLQGTLGLLECIQHGAIEVGKGDLLFGSNGLTVVHPGAFLDVGLKEELALGSDQAGRLVENVGADDEPLLVALFPPR